MSVAPLERQATHNTTVIERPSLQPRPSQRPKSKPRVHVRVQVTERRQARTNPALFIATRAIVFGVICLFTYATSSLAGQVMVEKARRQGIAAKERAIEARRAEATIRERVDSLTSARSIEEWALAHGLQTPPLPTEEGTKPKGGRTLVAKLTH